MTATITAFGSELRTCAWCGKHFIATDRAALYCRKSHSNSMRQHRRRIESVPIQRCPHPKKAAFTQRGDAVVAAAAQKHRFYLCRCGAFHLTSKASVTEREGLFALSKSLKAEANMTIETLATKATIDARELWEQHANEALDKCIELGVPFSADQLHGFIPEGVKPHHQNAIGAFFRTAERAGRIKHTGQFVRASRSPRHGNPNGLWIGEPQK